MPELPEVETTLRGIKPHIIHQKITEVVVRHKQLRWPLPPRLKAKLQGSIVQNIARRGKYLLFGFDHGTLILHLGMSGRLHILPCTATAQKHDHLDICFENQKCLRLTDPRRFGAVLWTPEPPEHHALLCHIGPEPLTGAFNGDYLYEQAQNKKIAIKSYIMDSRIVAGVGNIYATEALFDAGIHPERSAGSLTRTNYQALAAAIQSVLKKAIKKGGTTLKDFTRPSGSPGYFSVELQVYGRDGEPCLRCASTLRLLRLAQRSTVFCPRCQK